MTATRRTGSESSETRFLLLDVTEQMMIDEGYAAVSSRSIANEVGVTAALVHYYFPTLDDLFLAVFRRRAEEQLERHKRFLESAQPLRALWAFSREPKGTVFLTEFMALANHRKSIRSEIAAFAEQFRQVQLEALSTRLEEYGFDTTDVPPVALLTLIAGLGRSVVMEEALGMHTGLAELDDLADRFLDRFEGPALPKQRTRSRSSRPRRR